MGLVTSTIRLIYLNGYRLDLEYKMQLISVAKLNLSKSVNDLLNAGSDLEPDSPEMKALEKRKERLYMVEKQLDEQLQRYQVQLKMVEAEYESVQKQIDKNIQYAYGGR